MAKQTAKTKKPKPAAKGSAAADSPAPENAAAALQQARSVLDKLPMLGPVLWLYAHSPFHKHVFVGDMEWMVLPPLVLNQCKLYMKDNAPLAFASWAYLNEGAEKRLLSGQTRLAPRDWNSGERLWLIDLVTPFGGTKDIIKDIRENVFPTRDMKYLVPDFEKKGVRPVEWKAVKREQ